MKKIMLFVALAVIAVPAATYAAQIKSGEQVTVGKDEVINENLYTAGATLNISGTIMGDLMAAGGNVTVSGPVEKDATLAGGTVIVNGNVGEDMRVAGGNVTIDGQIGGDLVVAGGNIHITSRAVINGDLLAAGGQIINDGAVKGKISIADQSKHQPKERPKKEAGFFGMGAWWLMRTLMMFALALVLYYLLRPGTQAIIEKTKGNFGPELLRGFVILIVTPFALLVTAITIIGLPVAFAGLLVYGAIILIAPVFGALVLGSMVYSYIAKSNEIFSMKTLVVGIALYQLIKIIPIIGWLVAFVFFLAALGSFANALYSQTISRWRQTQ